MIVCAGGSTCTRYGVLVFIRLPLMQSSPSSKTMFSSRRLRTSEIASPEKQEKTNKITDNAVVFPFNLQVDDALKFFLRNASRFAFWSLVTIAQERIEVQHTFLHRHADDGLQSRHGTRYAAAFQFAVNSEIILEALDKGFVQL